MKTIVNCLDCLQQKQLEAHGLCKVCYNRKWRKDNKIEFNQKQLVRYHKVKQRYLIKKREYQKQYNKTDIGKCKSHLWKLNNKDKLRKMHTNYINLQRKINSNIKLNHNIGVAIRISLKKQNLSKKNSIENILGYSISKLKEHLESQFTPQMSWSNYGSYWHIDHKVPLSWFNYNSIEATDFKKAWSMENLQPLERSVNCSKQNKYVSGNLFLL